MQEGLEMQCSQFAKEHDLEIRIAGSIAVITVKEKPMRKSIQVEEQPTGWRIYTWASYHERGQRWVTGEEIKAEEGDTLNDLLMYATERIRMYRRRMIQSTGHLNDLTIHGPQYDRN